MAARRAGVSSAGCVHALRSSLPSCWFRFPVNIKNLSGLLLFPLALLIFAISDATAKYMSAYFAVPLLVWVRYVTQLVFMLATVAPGMGREIVVTPEKVAQFGKSNPMGRPAQPEEVAPAYVYLASDADAFFATGIVLPVMGGETAGG